MYDVKITPNIIKIGVNLPEPRYFLEWFCLAKYKMYDVKITPNIIKIGVNLPELASPSSQGAQLP
jgi:hypothetical protein